MIPPEQTSALILAGGHSRRMGRDKAQLLWQGRTFIEIIIQTLATVFSQIQISSNHPERYAATGKPIVPDNFFDQGPLAGLEAGLAAIATDFLFVVTCDTPLLSENLIRKMLLQAQPDRVSIAKISGQRYPLIGIYPVGIHAQILDFLQSGQRRVMDFLDQNKNRVDPVDLPDFWRELQNVNTPENYDKMRLMPGF